MNRKFFENLMAEKKLSLRALAAKMGMSHTQLSLTFSGYRRLQLNEAAELARILGTSLEQVAIAAGVPINHKPATHTTVIGALRGNGTVTQNDGIAIERVAVPGSLPGPVNAIQARTADSPLAWMDGWLFFISAKSEKPHAGLLGQFCYAKIKGGPAVLATVRRGYAEGEYALSGPYTCERARIESATPVLLVKP